MKRSIVIKTLIVILTFISFLSLTLIISHNVYASSSYDKDDYIDHNTGLVNGNRKDYLKLTKSIIRENEKAENDLENKPLNEKYKQNVKQAVYELRKVKSYGNAIAGLLDNVKEAFEGDPDWLEMGAETAKSVVNIFASIYGLGAVSDAIFDNAMSWGENPMTETQKLQEHLDEQFLQIQDNFDEVLEQTNALSLQLDENTEKIINALSDSLDSSYAKEKVIEFNSSTDGNFNYKRFKNYLLGSNDPSLNPFGYDEAYNANLTSLTKDNKECLEAYVTLYNALMEKDSKNDSNINMFYDYLLYDEESGEESITYYYFLYLLNNSKLLGDDIPEDKALDFLSQLYYTAVKAEERIGVCENYFYLELILKYGSNITDDSYIECGDFRITYKDIINSKKASEARLALLDEQIVKDVIYILNMSNSLVVEEADKEFRIMRNDGISAFGNINKGQTIYLHQLDEKICRDYFIDSDKFTYRWFVGDDLVNINDGILVVDENISKITGALYYNETEIFSIDFVYNDNTTFQGGNGSLTDPYIINTKEQFMLIYEIEDGYKKHYKLDSDIEFYEATLEPIGKEDKPFSGSFDGNGYKLSNFSISSNKDTSLFGYVDYNATISNLIIDKATVNLESDFLDYDKNGERKLDKVYAGVISSHNYGEIFNVKVNNSCINFNINTTVLNKSLNTFIGAIAAQNDGIISYVSVSDLVIDGIGKRNYQSESDGANATAYYIGGICGYSVNGTVNDATIDSLSTIDFSNEVIALNSVGTIKPYINIYVGGAIGNAIVDNLKNICSNVDDSKINASNKIDNEGFLGAYSNKNVNVKAESNVASLNDEEHKKFEVSLDKIIFPSYKFIDKTTLAFKGEFNEEFNCYDACVVKYDLSDFNIKNIQILLNDKPVEFEIDNYYINGHENTNLTENSIVEVVLFATVEFPEGSYVVKKIIPLVVKHPEIKNIEVIKLPLKTEYILNSSLNTEGLVIGAMYENGDYLDITNELTFEYNLNKYGDNIVKYYYGSYQGEMVITVLCEHNWQSEVVAPTCKTVGYTINKCDICGDVEKTDYVPFAKHSYELVNKVEATCTSLGYSGDIECNECGKVYSKGEELPLVSHKYDSASVDGMMHFCLICNHPEEHLFRITEAENEMLCTCVVCNYLVKYNSNSREEIEKLPRIIISDAYALPGDDEVVMYVELFSNIGITSAQFTIYFGDQLELIEYSNGNILYEQSTTAFKLYPDHLNVSLVKANTEMTNPNYENSNTLLKLKFKTPNDSKVGDKYSVYITNRVEKDSKGNVIFVDKFTDSRGSQLDFMAYNGMIRVVDRLPGDIVGDGTIDLLDAVVLSKYSVLDSKQESNGDDRDNFVKTMKDKYPDFDISYGDVTLDNLYTNADIVQILRYIVGGYEARILAKQFNITLNYNDGTGKEEVLSARLDENGQIILTDIPLAHIDGYRFDGWYYGFGSDAKKLISDEYKYVYDAIEQVLYAKYTLNKIEFEGNGAVGTMHSVTYSEHGDNYQINNEFVKESTISYIANCDVLSNKYDKVNHQIIGWIHYDEFGNTIKIYSPDEVFDLKNGEFGNIKLFALWAEAEISLINLDRVGYYDCAWATDRDGINVVGYPNDKYKIDNDIVLYADWTKIIYRLQYDGNKATSGTVVDNVEYRSKDTQSTPIEKNKFERFGYNFLGWNTKADGSGVFCGDEAKLDDRIFDYVSADVLVLYAQWDPIPYTVKFNYNKPSNSSTTMDKSNYSVTIDYDNNLLLADTATMTGWKFKGWYKDSACTQKVGDGGEELKSPNYRVGGEITLYAKWEAISYTVTYNPNFSGLTGGTSTHTYDTAFNLTKFNYSVSNYTFLGWSTSSTAQTPTYSDGASVSNLSTSEITLYGVWVKVSYNYSVVRTITIDEGEKYEEYINPSFDTDTLKKNNYTKITVTVIFDAQVIYSCYQRVIAYSRDTGKEFYGRDWDVSEDGWQEDLSYTFTVSIDEFQSGGSFWIRWECPNSNWRDQWLLGTTSITCVAKK